MSGEVMSVLSLEGRYYNCHERAQRARDNYDIVTRVIQLISPSQSCENRKKYFRSPYAVMQTKISI